MTHIADPTRSREDQVAELRAGCGDYIHLPGEPAYDEGRVPWNVAALQRPAAVAVPSTVDEIARVVRTAARVGLRVAPQNTGHAASTLVAGRLDDVVLVRTNRLNGVHVDPATQVARVEGGAIWRDVIAAAAPHGLTALHGSSPGIGVVGYSLGGGLGWYARKHGLAANSVIGVELVTADGEVLRADARTNAELFWALRGGNGGNFGIVTALELRLFAIEDAYAGMMLWDVSRAEEVVRAWAAWTAEAPDEVTTALRVMRFPPLPELPDFLRGRSLVIIDGAALLDDDTAGALLAPLRALGPELDTFGRVPAAALTELHMDPADPTPTAGAGTTVTRLDDAAVDVFLAQVGDGVETPIFLAEIRQAGGALARSDGSGGVLSHVPASHILMFLAMAFTPGMADEGSRAAEAAVAALSPWSEGRNFLNFAERAVDPGTAFEANAWARLQEIRAQIDPAGVFVANHVVPGRR